MDKAFWEEYILNIQSQFAIEQTGNARHRPCIGDLPTEEPKALHYEGIGWSFQRWQKQPVMRKIFWPCCWSGLECVEKESRVSRDQPIDEVLIPLQKKGAWQSHDNQYRIALLDNVGKVVATGKKMAALVTREAKALMVWSKSCRSLNRKIWGWNSVHGGVSEISNIEGVWCHCDQQQCLMRMEIRVQ